MKKKKCVANIKFSLQEVELMINALENLIKLEIPFQDSADWRKPYEMLTKDLKKIKLDMNNKIEEAMLNREHQETSTIYGEVCEVCE
jgi:hypothetical protein|tara:strand:+ start:3426 stop:3686 length:261 start_codon:yes stop_codon:yes gene_type:complete